MQSCNVTLPLDKWLNKPHSVMFFSHKYDLHTLHMSEERIIREPCRILEISFSGCQRFFFFAVKSFYCDKAQNSRARQVVFVLQNIQQITGQNKTFTFHLQTYKICQKPHHCILLQKCVTHLGIIAALLRRFCHKEQLLCLSDCIFSRTKVRSYQLSEC